MTWTRKKPTKPGWYWYRAPNGDMWIEEIDCIEGGAYSTDQYGRCLLVDMYDGEWAGPLEPPTESTQWEGAMKRYDWRDDGMLEIDTGEYLLRANLAPFLARVEAVLDMVTEPERTQSAIHQAIDLLTDLRTLRGTK